MKDSTNTPDLLDQLQKVTKQLRYINGWIDDENPELPQDAIDALEGIDETIQNAEAAIEKACG